MDRNTVIGLLLIVALIFVWNLLVPPPQAIDLKPAKAVAQSGIRAVKELAQAKQAAEQPADNGTPQAPVPADTARNQQISAELQQRYGAFAPFAQGVERDSVVENEVLRITFSNKGGVIKKVELKNYTAYDSAGSKPLVTLMDDPKNRLNFNIPMKGLSGGLNTADLYFEPYIEGNNVSYRAYIGRKKYLEIHYRLMPNQYDIYYNLKFTGLNEVLDTTNTAVRLDWVNYLHSTEKNPDYERTMTTTFFKEVEEKPDYCSCTKENVNRKMDAAVKWVSHKQQFFSATLIANSQFNTASLIHEKSSGDVRSLKVLKSTLTFNYTVAKETGFLMSFYFGPNEYNLLKQVKAGKKPLGLQNIIPYGWSLFGVINEYVFRPMFGFLASFLPSYGLIILILTFLVKLLLYPLQYRILFAAAKMQALKPEVEQLKTKFKDDAQRVQVESMKLYRESGANPLGGCLPSLAQMPIWLALYRFFPASIELRQEGFLWAQDLSTYDSIAALPFSIPFYGDHVSLFTLLWVVSMIWFTWYSSKTTDYSANPALKYMQYIFPVLFLFALNNYSSGLTCYMLFSNLLNIGMTMATKQFFFNDEKIRERMLKNREQPKKQSKFQARLEEAMKVQRERQEQLRKQQEQAKRLPKKK